MMDTLCKGLTLGFGIALFLLAIYFAKMQLRECERLFDCVNEMRNHQEVMLYYQP